MTFRTLIQSGFTFVRENPRLLYSLVLLIFVPAALFFNTYSTVSRVEQDIDRITQRKALLAEHIINILIGENIRSQAALQSTIDALKQNSDETLSLAFLMPAEEGSGFRVVASSEADTVGQVTENIQYVLAWNQPEGIASLERDETGRFWRVTRQLETSDHEKIGLVTMAFSLQDTDTLVGSTVNRSYLILIITVVVVLLLVSNQARLFGSVLALNKLKEVDAMKDNLISMASHELRSPLTAIRGYLELLRDKKLALDEQAQHYFANIEQSVDRLNLLVQDILEVSKLEGNRVPLNITDFEVEPLTKQCVEELRSQAIEKGLALTIGELAPAKLRADSDRTRQILINLVGNALKYTPKGSVTITGRVQDKQYLLTVADTGLGISAEDQKRLFQKFSRIQNEQTKAITGTGLGLWITQELAVRMGGAITVESITGVGSHFTLRLPISQA